MSELTFGKPALEIRFTKQLAMSFQLIPAGSFRMGSRDGDTDEEPIHTVRITKPFYLGTFPVTQAEFAVWTVEAEVEHQNAFPGLPTCPAENLDWNQATAFCHWLKATKDRELPRGYVATLPTESQWEYACRAGTATDYYTGDGDAALPEAGWFNDNSGDQTHPVGTLCPNEFGLYDMHGNVWEWCRDAWVADAYKKRVDGVADPEVHARDLSEENPGRVIRGGAWGDSAWYCRSAIRYWGWPDVRNWNRGFRVCLVPGPVAEPEQQSGTESQPTTGDVARRDDERSRKE